MASKPGDRVAVQVEKSLEALLLYLACLRAGAVFLPLNTAYTPAELDYFPRRRRAAASSSAIRARKRRCGSGGQRPDVAHVETLDANGGGSLTEQREQRRATFDDASRGPDDLAAILYTSAPPAAPRARC